MLGEEENTVIFYRQWHWFRLLFLLLERHSTNDHIGETLSFSPQHLFLERIKKVIRIKIDCEFEILFYCLNILVPFDNFIISQFQFFKFLSNNRKIQFGKLIALIRIKVSRNILFFHKYLFIFSYYFNL